MKILAEQADDSAPVHEEVNQKKPIDEAPPKNLFLFLEIGRKILVLLKCIVDLICLVLFVIVYIVSGL